jgi:hypothetical protein
MNKKRLAAAGKILRRCTICGKFHASYLVDDPVLGKYHLCYSCWKAKQAQEIETLSIEKIETEKLDRKQKQ